LLLLLLLLLLLVRKNNWRGGKRKWRLFKDLI